MHAPLEENLHDLLLGGSSPEQVVFEFSERWQQKLLNKNEMQSLAQFMLNAGLHEPLLALLTHSFESEMEIPWAQFSEVLARLQIKPSQAELRAIKLGLQETRGELDIAVSPAIDDWGKEFVSLRQAIPSVEKKFLARRREKLIEKLEFAKLERLAEVENDVLRELQNLFPADLELQRQRHDLQSRQARDVFNQKKSGSEPSDPELELQFTISVEEEEIAKTIRPQALELAKANSDTALDLALMFHFMDQPKFAIEMILYANKTAQRAILEFELLLAARLFLLCLEKTREIMEAPESEPDIVFAAQYYSAKALWGLRQKNLATEQIRQIVSVRSNYRDASLLLSQWTGGLS